jgi:adenylyl-sulfate kinase
MTIIWFTGLSGSGKTTIAELLKTKLENHGKTVQILDGDIVRDTLHKNLGFSREDIKENNRLIAQLAKDAKTKHDFILVPIIAPYREDREMAKSIVGDNFLELFINAPLQECIKRDVKGLYKKAIAGEIDNFIGISESNPYQKPLNPELEIRTDFQSHNESVQDILNHLKLK